MNDNSEPLWLHAYSGRENGLMVVGSPDSLKQLAQQLLTAVEAHPEKTSESWPPEIVAPRIIGPYTDMPDFALSFHIKGAAPLSEVVPLKRRTLPTPLFLAVAVCAITGVVTLLRWLLSYAF